MAAANSKKENAGQADEGEGRAPRGRKGKTGRSSLKERPTALFQAEPGGTNTVAASCRLWGLCCETAKEGAYCACVSAI